MRIPMRIIGFFAVFFKDIITGKCSDFDASIRYVPRSRRSGSIRFDQKAFRKKQVQNYLSDKRFNNLFLISYLRPSKITDSSVYCY
ncbi:hypothetical protein LEP1GSC050_1108 [Leptospira broomii serovar Hurstbridge str. 5399]|uniref:Uncharacterized protein n=1 Tax=Leptospira broomii serovar Hurstbridge str. 5399 TaxID=1049789 RepID=T0FGL1_9LEPT|nr:hypothetical protein LEP1GSC050_1108 [Leptospira broomii serovar Hurstbridge str. 5399]